MPHQSARSEQWSAWRVALLAAVLLGGALRLVNLEGKPYWFNEVFTSLHVSGFNEHDHANRVLYTGRVVTADDVQRFQRLRADGGYADVLKNVARKDVKWGAGYWMMARLWAELWGPTVLAMRTLSALLGLAIFPGLYWLCRELFDRGDVAWTAMALHAVSPLFLEQAQSARPWSLSYALLVLSTAALLSALRTRRTRAWVVYGLCVSMSLNMNVWLLLAVGVHAVYVVGNPVPRRAVRDWALAAGAGLLTFVPWAAVIAWNWSNAVATAGHLRVWPGAAKLTAAWGDGFSRVFCVLPEGPLALGALAALLALVSGSMWDVYRRTEAVSWSMVMLLIASAIVTAMVPDLLFHTQVSSRARYLGSTFVGAQLSLAFMLAVRSRGISPLPPEALPQTWEGEAPPEPLRSTESRCPDGSHGGSPSHWTVNRGFGAHHRPDNRRAAVWRTVTAVLLVAGAVTCVGAVRADTWWGLSAGDVAAGRILGRAHRPLVLSTSNYGTVTPLTYEVPPDTSFVLFGGKTPLVLPAWDGEVYAYRPSPALAAALARHGELHRACDPHTRGECVLYRLHMP